MVMSTPTLAKAASLLETNLLIDLIGIYEVGDLVTEGIEVKRELTLLKSSVAGLVQATTLQNAIESAVETLYSVKVTRDTRLEAGMAVKVERCVNDPSLVGKTLYLDKVSSNGLALIRKGVASDTYNVDQQGAKR